MSIKAGRCGQAGRQVNGAGVAVAVAVAGTWITRVLHDQVAAPLVAGRLDISLAPFERPFPPLGLILATPRPGLMVKARFAGADEPTVGIGRDPEGC
ncbi:MAG: hypothetical protein ACFCBW_05525 [Candidatus Competibacterales bacterium]